MTLTQYRSAIDRVGLSQVGAARFFGANPRTGQRWAADGPPPAVAVCLRLMIALDLSAEEAAKFLKMRRALILQNFKSRRQGGHRASPLSSCAACARGWHRWHKPRAPSTRTSHAGGG